MMALNKTSPWEEGDPEAEICLLGTSPSKIDMSWKRPFVGQEGDVLNDCLRSAGIARRHCYILNLWKEHVQKNKQDQMFLHNRLIYDPRKGFTDDGMDAAREALAKLDEIRPKITVTLGRPAFHMMASNTKPLMKWRGSPLWSERFKRKYIPTVHPDATIYGVYAWRFFIQNDLAKSRLEMDSYDLVLPPRELIIAPTLADVYHFMHECREAGVFATDIEVINHQVSCFSLAPRSDRAMTIPFVDDRGQPYWSEDDEVTVWKWYESLMSDEKLMKVNQNIAFDIGFLLDRNHIRTRGPIGDTMIAQHIIYPHFPKGLDFIASYHTREPYWKDEGKVWKNPKIDWPTFQRYCGKDAAVALEAWSLLSDEMSEGGYWDTYNMTIDMLDSLIYMTVRGLAVDRDRLEATKTELETTIEKKQAELDAITFSWGHLNPASPKACQEYFYEYLGIHPYKNAEGGITTDDRAMSRIFRKSIEGSKEAKLVQEIRALRKLKGTYIDVTLDPDGRLRCSWNPRGTWTGRLSSSQTIFGTGMNLQNLHPKFKGFIIGG
jgi:uracil-DNA glycosylase family 4